jgi:hypothetical protein
MHMKRLLFLIAWHKIMQNDMGEYSVIYDAIDDRDYRCERMESI